MSTPGHDHSPLSYGPPPPLRKRAAAPQRPKPPASAAAVPAIAWRGHYARNASWYVTCGLLLVGVGWLLGAAGLQVAVALVVGGALALLLGIVGVVQNIESASANVEYLAVTLNPPPAQR